MKYRVLYQMGILLCGSLLAIAENSVTVHPVEIDTAFKNPGKGWMQYIYSTPISEIENHNKTVLSSMVYCNYFLWRHLEPNYEGDYRWEIIDNFVAFWADPSRNKKISIGIHLTDPHSIPGTIHIPQWVYEDSRMSGRWYDNFYSNPMPQKKFEPDYWNPFFLEKLGKFLKALGDRYYQTPLWQQYIERIDISTYGYWGEWHSQIEWPDHETKIKTLRTMMDQYVTAFPRDRVPTPMLAMDIVGWGKKEMQDVGIYHAVQDLGAMMVRRCMGWPEATHPDQFEFIKNNVKNRKFHSEWGSIDGSLYTMAGGMDTFRAVQMALDLGSSCMGWYQTGGSSETGALNQIVPETGETIEEYYQKRSGYRFVLTEAAYPNQVRPGQTFSLRQSWHQKGVARLYETYYHLKAYLQNDSRLIPLNTDPNFPAAEWANGGPYAHRSEFRVPDSVPEGWYVLKIAVVDFTGEPAMNLAIAGKDEPNPTLYGRYPLGQIYIGAEATTKTPMPLFNPKDTSLIEQMYFDEQAIREDGGWYGIRVTVGDQPVRVTAIGRYALEGNTQSHPAKIVRVSDRATVARSQIDLSNPYADTAGFKYGLTEAILKPQTTYYVLCQELAGQDKRLDYVKVKTRQDTALKFDGVAWDQGSFGYICAYGQTDSIRGGVNLRYRVEPQPKLTSLIESSSGDVKRYVGMKITVKDRAVRVREIGTRVSDDRKGMLNLAIIRESDKDCVSWGNMVNMGLGQANANGFKFTATDILLKPNQSYYVMSYETVGCNLDSTVELKTSPDFTIDGPACSDDLKTFNVRDKLNHSIRAIDLRYEYVNEQPLITSVELSETKLEGPTGWYGMKITVGDKPVVVYELGRYRGSDTSHLPKMYQERGRGLIENHALRLVRASDQKTLASSGVGIWGKTDQQGFGYGILGQLLTLEPNTCYYVLCNEMEKSDPWYSGQTKVEAIAGISINGPVKTCDFITFDVTENPGHSYGPVNLKCVVGK